MTAIFAAPRNTRDPETWQAMIRRTDRSHGTVAAERYGRLALNTTIYHQRVVPDGTYLDRDEVITVPVLTRIPKNQFNTLVLEAFLGMARGRVLGPDQAQDLSVSTSKSSVVVATRLPSDGLLQKLTRGDRFLRVKYNSTAGKGLYYPEISFGRDRRTSAPDFDKRLRRFYGVSVKTGEAVITTCGY